MKSGNERSKDIAICFRIDITLFLAGLRRDDAAPLFVIAGVQD
jgi:hypothetical protein